MLYDFSVWYWGDWIALDGLLDASELVGDDSMAAAVHVPVTRWAQRIKVDGPAWIDHMTPGAAALRVAARFDAPSVLEAVERVAEFLHHGPRSRWLGAPLRRPDLYTDRNLLVVDSIYNEGPLFAHLFRATGDPKYLDWCRACLEPTIEGLLNPASGVFRQAIHTANRRELGNGWARGNGWALLGILDSLDAIPRDRPEYESLSATFRGVAERLLPLQDTSGFWHTILHNKQSYLETSTAAFFAASFDKGTRLGLLDEERFGPAADRAMTALLSRVDDSGDVIGVSQDSFPDDEPAYLPLPMGVNEWGQGCALRALTERLYRS
jgi:unsaturated rhamnogalacturonyl hydrolase